VYSGFNGSPAAAAGELIRSAKKRRGSHYTAVVVAGSECPSLGGRLVVSIRITAWNKEAAWTGFAGYHPRDLERRLLRLTGRARGEVKRLVRQLKSRECIRLLLPAATDLFAAESLRSFFESLGAVVKVEDAEQIAAADRPRE
jgi:hypothetical protein